MFASTIVSIDWRYVIAAVLAAIGGGSALSPMLSAILKRFQAKVPEPIREQIRDAITKENSVKSNPNEWRPEVAPSADAIAWITSIDKACGNTLPDKFFRDVVLSGSTVVQALQRRAEQLEKTIVDKPVP